MLESLLNSLDTPASVYSQHHHNSSSESIYDWPSLDSLLSPDSGIGLENPLPPNAMGAKIGSDTDTTCWSPDMWDFTTTADGLMDGAEGQQQHLHQPRSVLSFSDESLTSGGEEFSSVELGSVRSASGSGKAGVPSHRLSLTDGHAALSPEELHLGDLDLDVDLDVFASGPE